ncbi:hypothetical protein Tco_0681654 [Tanacetum coccineum]|uniref:Uncharacterized protein n=1 Tax=Tanacetum coccineum TaxID=301880 RepID=A0ABQ4XQJ6_9ASTR
MNVRKGKPSVQLVDEDDGISNKIYSSMKKPFCHKSGTVGGVTKKFSRDPVSETNFPNYMRDQTSHDSTTGPSSHDLKMTSQQRKCPMNLILHRIQNMKESETENRPAPKGEKIKIYNSAEILCHCLAQKSIQNQELKECRGDVQNQKELGEEKSIQALLHQGQ